MHGVKLSEKKRRTSIVCVHVCGYHDMPIPCIILLAECYIRVYSNNNNNNNIDSIDATKCFYAVLQRSIDT